MTPVHWHILGAGAMGCLWAHALQQAGHHPCLIVRSLPPQPLALRYEYQDTISDSTVPATDNPAPRSITHLLVTTKATDAVAAVMAHREALAPGARIVLLQNGMGQHQSIVAALPDRAVYAALSTDGAWLRTPGHVVHAGQGLTRVGGLTASATQETLLPALAGLPLALEWVDDIVPALWLKLGINCAINALTAIHRCSNGELLDNGPRQQCMQRLCDEVVAVMSAEGIALPDGSDLYAAALATAQATARNRSSTLQDVLAGRPTELPALNGFIVARARALGIATPENCAVLQQLSLSA